MCLRRGGIDPKYEEYSALRPRRGRQTVETDTGETFKSQ